jgi:DNA-binding CsgD family transcriptional regulator
MLDDLAVVAKERNLMPLGAWLFGPDPSITSHYVVGRNTFIHDSIPADYVKEWRAKAAQYGPSVLARMAFQNRGLFTFTECMRASKVAAGDRWIFRLLAKYGVRDGVYCPVGVDPLGRHGSGLWVIAFWSPDVVTLNKESRRLIYGVSWHVAHRLHEIASHDYKRTPPTLSARELSVLDDLSCDIEVEDIARRLQLSDATVRTYVQRAQDKLGVKTRPGAIAKAMRLMLLR